MNRGRNLTVANNKYIGEALAGYHFDPLNGVNVEAGYFYSYIGLESYLLGENWNYTARSCPISPPFISREPASKSLQQTRSKSSHGS